MPAGPRESLVLITGASTGIGRAAAQAFLARGDRVVGLARSADKLESLARSHGAGERFLALPVDVTDSAGMQAAAERILSEHGPPDVIVANAGVGLDALFSLTSDDALRRVFDVNVFGVVRTVRPFLPAMIDRGSGRIVVISSVVGKRGLPHYSAYSGSKFALHGIADALRAELVGTGVSVGLLCPSSTESEFQERALRHGPGQRRFRPRRQSAAAVARAVVRMAGSRRRERVLTAEARLLILCSRLAPGLVDRFLSRMLRVRRSRDA